MLAFVSPAKSLDYERPAPAVTPTRAAFADEAGTIAAAAARLSAARLRQLMGISEALATLNVARFRGFADAPERPAAFAFAGDVYRGLDAPTLDEPALAFAQDHLRILSGLYGLLRPLDLLRPYRLEMGTAWAPGRAPDLYAFWGKRLPAHLAAEVAAEGSGELLNLASNEYWKALDGLAPPGARVVAVDFRERTARGLRFNSFAAKHARGLMARWICEHRIARIDDLRGFDAAGWRHDAGGSEPDHPRFVREA